MPLLAEELLEQLPRTSVAAGRVWLLRTETAKVMLEMLAQGDNHIPSLLAPWHETGTEEPIMDRIAHPAHPLSRLAIRRVTGGLRRFKRVNHRPSRVSNILLIRGRAESCAAFQMECVQAPDTPFPFSHFQNTTLP